MKFEKRIEVLESHFLKEEIDPKLDAEITEWFKLHPEYNPCAQPESNKIVMPEYLRDTFQHRIKNMFTTKKCLPNFFNLKKFWKEIYP